MRWKTSKSCYAELLWAGKLSLVVVIGGCTRTSLIQQQGFLDVTQKNYMFIEQFEKYLYLSATPGLLFAWAYVFD